MHVRLLCVFERMHAHQHINDEESNSSVFQPLLSAAVAGQDATAALARFAGRV